MNDDVTTGSVSAGQPGTSARAAAQPEPPISLAASMAVDDKRPEVLSWYQEGTRRVDLPPDAAHASRPGDPSSASPATSMAGSDTITGGPVRRVILAAARVRRGIARRGLRGLDRYEFTLDDLGSGGVRKALEGIYVRIPRTRPVAKAHPAASAGNRNVTFDPIGFRQASDATDLDAARLELHGAKRIVERSIRRAKRARSVSIGPLSTMTSDQRLDVCRVGATGAALVARASTPLAGGDIRADLDAIVTSTTVAAMRDARSRELHSVRVRRAALGELREAAAQTGNGETILHPSVSVLMASNRPEDLDHALDGIARQSVRDFEIVIGLHGSRWNAAHRRHIDERFGERAVTATFDESKNLGEVLNELSVTASGDVVTKWDDDDWYGAHHIEDLLNALVYSGADIVGKAAEFVRLEQLDLTIRRFAVGAETYTSTLAGGTLMLRRSTLASVGGWSPTPRNVDRNLIEAVVGVADGTSYRTHGYEYVLRRRSADHTWAADERYFLSAANEVRAGLDLQFAGIDD